MVLFGHSPAERAAETGAAERTLYRQVARFEELGMASFVPPPRVEKHRTLPAHIRQAILDVKREHPPLGVNEIRTICWARFAHRPSSATVKRVLAEAPRPRARTTASRPSAGYIRFRRWRVYAERGLPGEPVAVWLYAEHLTLVYKDEALAQYRVAYQPDKRHLKTVTEERRFETPHQSPQPTLWAWGEGEWLRVLRLPDYAPRRRPATRYVQSTFLLPEEVGSLRGCVRCPATMAHGVMAPLLYGRLSTAKT